MNLEDGNERPVKSVKVLAVAGALFRPNLAARADVFVDVVTAELATEQMHSKHAAAQHVHHMCGNKGCVCTHILGRVMLPDECVSASACNNPSTLC